LKKPQGYYRRPFSSKLIKINVEFIPDNRTISRKILDLLFEFTGFFPISKHPLLHKRLVKDGLSGANSGFPS